MNKVELEGALPRDPELKFLPSGIALCEFSIVLNDVRWDKEKRESVAVSEYIGCQAWGQTGEDIAEKFRKGDRLYVFGKLKRRVIEKDDGKKDEKVRVEVLWWQPTLVRRHESVGAQSPAAKDDPWASEPPF